jgi:hypothetical protein
MEERKHQTRCLDAALENILVAEKSVARDLTSGTGYARAATSSTYVGGIVEGPANLTSEVASISGVMIRGHGVGHNRKQGSQHRLNSIRWSGNQEKYLGTSRVE